MYVTDTKKNDGLFALLKCCQDELTHDQTLRQNYLVKVELVNQQQQNVEAAENTAKTFREQAHSVLRELLGKPSKKLHDLRAEERSAYRLDEDYRCFISELELARDEAELDMHMAGHAYIRRREDALEGYAKTLMEDALAQSGLLIKAIALTQDAYLREGRFAMWKQQGYNEAIDAIMALVKRRIRQKLYMEKPDLNEDEVTTPSSAVTPRSDHAACPLAIHHLSLPCELPSRIHRGPAN
ncbi:hypothetical protein [Paludibacterium yongneupense]|uniref:hypothetical protein n=1 Tax=Paludibacterium yongneupense TaxID=400061 RepID=UPI000424A9EE|nr:hypothetical protein [Paludibacterium yongneupense]